MGHRNPRGGPLSDFGCAVRVTHVSSLWTPGGEHKVDPATERDGLDDAGRDDAGRDDAGPDEISPDEAAVRAELDEVRRQLAQVPAEVVVANHAMGLYELAAIHLSEQPPNADAAKLAIDAMGSLVDGLKGRLGEPENTLRDALAQLRLAFVQVTSDRAWNATFPSTTSTPSARRRRACSTSWPGTSRPCAVTTRHQGKSSSDVASSRPTARAAPDSPLPGRPRHT